MTQDTVALAGEMFNFIIKANEQLVADGESAMKNTELGLAEVAKANGILQGKAEILNGMADLLKEFLNR